MRSWLAWLDGWFEDWASARQYTYVRGDRAFVLAGLRQVAEIPYLIVDLSGVWIPGEPTAQTATLWREAPSGVYTVLENTEAKPRRISRPENGATWREITGALDGSAVPRDLRYARFEIRNRRWLEAAS